MQGERVFEVTYTEAMTRDAVKTYVWKRGILGRKIWWLIEAALIGVVLWSGDFRWTNIVAVLAGPLLLVILSLDLYREKIGKFRRMPSPQVIYTFGDEGFNLACGPVTTDVSWSAIIHRWERTGYWMLFFTRSRFMVLPTAALPSGVLDILRIKIPMAG